MCQSQRFLDLIICLVKGNHTAYKIFVVNQFAYFIDLFEEVCLLFSIIMTGSEEGEHLILHLLEGT